MEEEEDQPMQPTNQQPKKDEVLMRGYVTMHEDCLKESFVSYVRVGNEVIARTKNGKYISYFRVRG